MTWWLPSDPDDIKPDCWLHPAATLYLESLLTPEMTVIEHGCGGSTLWFAERVKSVVSYEQNDDWFENINKIRPINVFMCYAKLPMLDTDIDADLLPFDPDIDVDLLFIDGNNHDRPAWLMAAQSLVKEGGIIVLDNAEREHYQAGRKHLLTFCHMPLAIAATTGLGKFVVTEFFRVKGGAEWI